jgi:hypothetical protein
MPARRQRHSEKARQRISRGTRNALARKRELARVRPADLDVLRRNGTVSAPLRPFLDAADLEGLELSLAYEGDPAGSHYRPLSTPRRVLLDDLLRMGLVLRGELARYLQSGDSDAGARVGTLAANRRATLQILGLEHPEHEVSLTDYLDRRGAENRAGGSDGSGRDRESA